jgi:hypothetical protein
MRTIALHLLLHIAIVVQAQSYIPGQTYFSANGHIEYRCGDLPLVISVPHGGALVPADIPDRTCNDPVYDVDANTAELGDAIDSVFAVTDGCRPHVVINHLARRKLDANRNLTDGACGDPQAVLAWQAFHAFIDSAKARVTATAGRGFYLDLHGHGHTVQRLELGYLLYEDELALPDATLNTSTYIDYSSIRALALQNQLTLTHAELLRGPLALGTRLASLGYPSVPSQQDPFPLQGQAYFSGGYNTARHSSYNGGAIDGVQMECNFSGVRDTRANRARFADSLRVALTACLADHYFAQPPSCTVGFVDRMPDARPFVWPSPAESFVQVGVPGRAAGEVVHIIDVMGRAHLQGTSGALMDVRSLPAGAYFAVVGKGRSAKFFKQ